MLINSVPLKVNKGPIRSPWFYFHAFLKYHIQLLNGLDNNFLGLLYQNSVSCLSNSLSVWFPLETDVKRILLGIYY